MEIAEYKTGKNSSSWSVNLLNIVCALIPAVGLFLNASYAYQRAVRYAAHLIMPSTLVSLIDFLISFGHIMVIGSMLLAGAVFFLSESPKAKAAATSTVAGFFLGLVALIIFSSSIIAS